MRSRMYVLGSYVLGMSQGRHINSLIYVFFFLYRFRFPIFCSSDVVGLHSNAPSHVETRCISTKKTSFSVSDNVVWGFSFTFTLNYSHRLPQNMRRGPLSIVYSMDLGVGRRGCKPKTASLCQKELLNVGQGTPEWMRAHSWFQRQPFPQKHLGSQWWGERRSWENQHEDVKRLPLSCPFKCLFYGYQEVTCSQMRGTTNKG